MWVLSVNMLPRWVPSHGICLDFSVRFTVVLRTFLILDSILSFILESTPKEAIWHIPFLGCHDRRQSHAYWDGYKKRDDALICSCFAWSWYSRLLPLRKHLSNGSRPSQFRSTRKCREVDNTSVRTSGYPESFSNAWAGSGWKGPGGFEDHGGPKLVLPSLNFSSCFPTLPRTHQEWISVRTLTTLDPSSHRILC